MKNLKRTFFILFLITTSCDQLIIKKEHRDTIRNEEWIKLHRSEVEEPPLFITCEDITETDSMYCFQQTLIQHINNHINKEVLLVSENITDTLWITLLINQEGVIHIEEYELSEFLAEQLPNFNTLLHNSITTLPTLQPAHIRGVPVNVSYRLPVVLNTN
ncbi:hypothetical protein ACE939_14675 [Aquimarina sp. W85]|uniref:hypothetical protein n=1 Tax=Aquimarina rhodophyticola TaxID=3342246 RepID=UPI0036734C3E